MSRILKTVLCWVVIMGLLTLIGVWFSGEWNAALWSEERRNAWLHISWVVLVVLYFILEDD